VARKFDELSREIEDRQGKRSKAEEAINRTRIEKLAAADRQGINRCLGPQRCRH
jgi:hypothetical protein